MTPYMSGSLIDDVAYLASPEHRASTLVALTVRPRSRSELWEMAGISSSTIRRTLSDSEQGSYVRVYRTANYIGYFPFIHGSGDYWWDDNNHEYEIWGSGHYTVMTGEMANDVHYWKSKAFFDGSTFYLPGGLQADGWYIV